MGGEITEPQRGWRADIRNLRVAVASLKKTLTEYHEEVVAHISECKACRENVVRHDLILEGPPDNGSRPGMRTRLDRVEGVIHRSWVVTRWAVGILSALLIAGASVWLGWR